VVCGGLDDRIVVSRPAWDKEHWLITRAEEGTKKIVAVLLRLAAQLRLQSLVQMGLLCLVLLPPQMLDYALLGTSFLPQVQVLISWGCCCSVLVCGLCQLIGALAFEGNRILTRKLLAVWCKHAAAATHAASTASSGFCVTGYAHVAEGLVEVFDDVFLLYQGKWL
jgi:hypothetical protein